MKKVMTFGTFDILHPGHEYYLKEAKKHGDKLYVVIARDSTVRAVKGKFPQNSEIMRMAAVRDLPFVDEVILGNTGDKLAVIEQTKPDTICIGYDQNSFTKNLKEKLKERGLEPEIIQFEEGFNPDIYKSSKL